MSCSTFWPASEMSVLQHHSARQGDRRRHLEGARSTAVGGGGTWTSYTLDVREGELFVSVGNPAHDMLPDERPGDNLFTNSLVVLNARTGGLKWWCRGGGQGRLPARSRPRHAQCPLQDGGHDAVQGSAQGDQRRCPGLPRFHRRHATARPTTSRIT
ncbi:hypothetical protein [Bradyrhizobium erythrophlei]|uniref:hypothetical protein n=1 Tax=Bradyrhizobium erythrophlei TaxID=1437360 RepID=UPI00406BC45A